MASAEEVAALRLLIGEPYDVEPWEDSTLSDLLDANDGDKRTVAAEVWEAKAAAAAGLVNVTESGSSRSLGDQHKNALSMAAAFRNGAETGVAGSERSARTRPIVRRDRG